jgi:hypothetical protein
MSTPRLESHADPTAKHWAALAGPLGWTVEAVACGDDVYAPAWAQPLEATGEEHGDEYSRRAPRAASARGTGSGTRARLEVA